MSVRATDRVRFYIAAALLAALATFILSEGVLRVSGFGNYWTLSRSAEPDLGWIPQAHVRSAQLGEGEATIRTNRLGFRGPDFGPKAEGTLRIAVLGDSFTEAVQVDEAQTWWGQLAPALDACQPAPRRAVEVLNFGVSGYSTAQALIALEKYALPAAPDIVVLNFFPGNDFEDNSRALSADPMRPFFELTDGTLRRDDRFRDLPGWRLRASPGWRYAVQPLLGLRTVQLLDAARHRWAVWRNTLPPASPLEAEPGVDLAIYREPATPEWHEAWAVTETLLAEFERKVRAGGAEFILMLATTGYQTLPAARRERFAQHHNLPDLNYPQRRLQALSEREGWNVLNLLPVFQFWADHGGAITHGFPNTEPFIGHWNERGHEIAAQALAARICDGFERRRQGM